MTMANKPDPLPPPAELARAHDQEARIAHEREALRGLYEEQLKELHRQRLEMARPKQPAWWRLAVASALVLVFLAAIGYLGLMVLAVSARVDVIERRTKAEASAREAASPRATAASPASSSPRSK